MNHIVTTDLHLTDRARDEYRFGLFPWLRVKIKKHRAQTLLILGDLTDEKDHHSSVLVNRIVDEIAECAHLCSVYLVKGNHDYIDPNSPFFGFLQKITAPNLICYINKPTATMLPGIKGKVVLVPHMRRFELEPEMLDCELMFLHQTFKGAKSSNGRELEGLRTDVVGAKAKRVYSGDIHVPQVVGRRVNYIGSPYHVHFGDRFKSRVVMLDEKTHTDLHFNTVEKHILDLGYDEFQTMFRNGGPSDIKPHDQVKVRLTIEREDLADSMRIRREVEKACDKASLDLCGLELRLRGYLTENRLLESTAKRKAPLEVIGSVKKIDDNTRKVGIDIYKSVTRRAK